MVEMLAVCVGVLATIGIVQAISICRLEFKVRRIEKKLKGR